MNKAEASSQKHKCETHTVKLLAANDEKRQGSLVSLIECRESRILFLASFPHEGRCDFCNSS